MGRTSLTFGQFGDEIKPLSEDEIKPLSEVELLTLSRQKKVRFRIEQGLLRMLRTKP